MARTDAIVLGAGIVGVSAALHLAKRGLAVALVDRRPPGEETSYGNAGIIEGNTLFPHAFPSGFGALIRIALKQAPEANYHLSFLPKVASWLMAYRHNTRAEGSLAFAEAMRPLFSRAVSEHEALMAESGAARYLRKDGWIKLYRSDEAFAASARERELAETLGLQQRALNVDETRALEPSLNPVFRHGVHWPEAASVSNPLAVTKAYVARFTSLGGVVLNGDAGKLHRADGHWRVETNEGPVDANDVVVALGPWAPDLLARFGIDLPIMFKRGYHRHFRPAGNAGLTRPIVDTANGYCLAPMEQGIRLTTGAEFADRDAPPTPEQFGRLMPAARALMPLGDAVETQPWMGSRPCFPDSMPVIGRAPGQPGLWLDYGHAHWGLTLGPVSGRLIADMVTGTTPVCDPKPYAAERFKA
ncbi:MAG: FAD-dependent oxidoreductase [Hyphomicrobiales bacterium]|nr:FAD-dependent oxidoreductase [Alphaproteobacteria bacterium]